MSLDTWKKEFYPEPAKDVEKEDAAKHSLRKWQGLTKENLDKHDVMALTHSYRTPTVINIRDLHNDWRQEVRIDSYSCALCTTAKTCAECVLCTVRDGVPCDKVSQSEQKDNYNMSPFHTFVSSGDPSLMIMWLTKAVQLEEK